jgi:hypothetical protein
MPCGQPAPGRPFGHPGSGPPQGILGGFSYYQLVILIFNIVPLIMEFHQGKGDDSGFQVSSQFAPLRLVLYEFRNAWLQGRRGR